MVRQITANIANPLPPIVQHLSVTSPGTKSQFPDITSVAVREQPWHANPQQSIGHQKGTTGQTLIIGAHRTFVALAGAWKDMPTAEDLREGAGEDLPRATLITHNIKEFKWIKGLEGEDWFPAGTLRRRETKSGLIQDLFDGTQITADALRWKARP
jgi:hypothetical protein